MQAASIGNLFHTKRGKWNPKIAVADIFSVLTQNLNQALNLVIREWLIYQKKLRLTNGYLRKENIEN